MNRDKGITISNCWTATLSHAQPMMRVASSSNQHRDDDILDHDEDMKWKQKWKQSQSRSRNSRLRSRTEIIVPVFLCGILNLCPKEDKHCSLANQEKLCTAEVLLLPVLPLLIPSKPVNLNAASHYTCDSNANAATVSVDINVNAANAIVKANVTVSIDVANVNDNLMTM